MSEPVDDILALNTTHGMGVRHHANGRRYAACACGWFDIAKPASGWHGHRREVVAAMLAAERIPAEALTASWNAGYVQAREDAHRQSVDRAHQAEVAVKRVRALADEWATAVEPNGTTSIAPVRWMAAQLHAVLDAPDSEPAT